MRGVYPDDINETIAAAASRGFARHTKNSAFVLSTDARLSGPFLKSAVIWALVDEGAYVVDIGLAPVPLVSFTMKTLGIPAGIIISASADPPECNGLKFRVLTKAGSVDELNADFNIKEPDSFAGRRHYRAGKRETHNPLPAYLAYMTAAARGIGIIKIAADYGNGVAAITARPLFERLRLSVVHLFPEPDGLQPNHSTDPDREENFTSLRAAILETKAEIGLFFNGDASCVRVVDERGEVVASHVLSAILARDSRRKPAFGDSRLSGESAVKDDGLLTSLAIMRAMTRANAPLSALTAMFQ